MLLRNAGHFLLASVNSVSDGVFQIMLHENDMFHKENRGQRGISSVERLDTPPVGATRPYRVWWPMARMTDMRVHPWRVLQKPVTE